MLLLTVSIAEPTTLRSRECPRYRLEQDILHLANSNFISLGSARRELSYRLGKGGEATSYAGSLGPRLSSQPTARTRTSNIPLSATNTTSSSADISDVPVMNRYSVLMRSNEVTAKRTSPATVPIATTSQNHRNHSPSHKKPKRQHSSAESMDSQEVSNIGNVKDINETVCVAEMETSQSPAESRLSCGPASSSEGNVGAAEPTSPSPKTASASVGDAEVPRPVSHSHSQDSTSVGNAVVPRPGSRSFKAIPRPDNRSHKVVKAATTTKLNRDSKLQGKVGAGKSLTGTRPKVK